MPVVNIKARLRAYVKITPIEQLTSGLGPDTMQQVGALAGTLGYYYNHIDLENKKIYLSTIRTLPTIGGPKAVDPSFPTPDYPIGGGLSVVNGSKYDYGSEYSSAKVAAVEHNVITYEGDIGFTEISEVAEENRSIDDYTLFVIEAPQVGLVAVRSGATAFGTSQALGTLSFAAGALNKAEGNYSAAFGRNTIAYYAAFAEGHTTAARGYGSHAEGRYTIAMGEYSHAEGNQTEGYAVYGHVEGLGSKTLNRLSYGAHAEGTRTTASAASAHSEGSSTTASGGASHAEGMSSIAAGSSSHAEGHTTQSNGNYSHSEGRLSIAGGVAGHAEGYETQADKEASHAEGRLSKALGVTSHAEGMETQATGSYSHSQGQLTVSSGWASHAEGDTTEATKRAAHAEGKGTHATGDYSHAQGWNTTASGQSSFAGGNTTEASGANSIALGTNTHATNYNAFAVGSGATASGHQSAAFGSNTSATNTNAVAFGNGTTASGVHSAAFGNGAIASGGNSFAAGGSQGGVATEARGGGSFALGNGVIAKSQSSFALGLGTVAARDRQVVIGQYNQENTTDAFVIGWGWSAASPVTVHTVSTGGGAWYKGGVRVGGSDYASASNLATEAWVNAAIGNLKTVMEFRGAFASLADCPNPVKGNVVAITSGTNAGKEFVYSGTEWIEFGSATADQAAITALANSKLDKMSGDGSWKVYAVNPSGQQTSYVLSSTPASGTLPYYQESGQLRGGRAVLDDALVPLTQMNEALGGKLDKDISATQYDAVYGKKADGTQGMRSLAYRNIANFVPVFAPASSTEVGGADHGGTFAVAYPTQPYQAAPKKYVDDLVGSMSSPLPSVTEADNGKFLRVVAGAWAAALVPSAEEEAF